MRRLTLGLLAFGTALSSLVLLTMRTLAPARPRVVAPYFLPIRVARALPEPAAPPAPPAPRRVGCDRSPDQIGSALAKPTSWDATSPQPGELYWQFAAGIDQCVIAVWAGATVFASWDDGATFSRVLDDPDPPRAVPAAGTPILGVTILEKGAVFVLRDTYRLGVARPDGSSEWRTLSFRGPLQSTGHWLVVTEPGPAISDDNGATWRHLDWHPSMLVGLRILDDGTIVAEGDLRGLVCGHLGCDGPTTEILESHLDGRPWKPASARHVRAYHATRTPAVRPPPSVPWATDLDSHRLPLQMNDGRHLARYTGKAGWRLLFTGAAS